MSALPTVVLPVSLQLIIRCVAEEYDLSERALYARRKDNPTAEARSAVYWLARKLDCGSNAFIGRALEGRDHTCVIYGARACERRRAEDADFAARLDGILTAIGVVQRSRTLAPRFADPDPVAVAERIIRSPFHAVTRVSALETIAIGARLLDLEEVAASTYQLLAHIDVLKRGTKHRDPLAASTRALIDTVASALAALGYESNDDEIIEQEKANERPQAAE